MAEDICLAIWAHLFKACLVSYVKPTTKGTKKTTNLAHVDIKTAFVNTYVSNQHTHMVKMTDAPGVHVLVNHEPNIIVGFDDGADKYLVKPINRPPSYNLRNLPSTP